MMKAILAKKIGMTTIFETDGKSVPVTLMQAGPCQVTLVREMGEKGKQVQLGFGEKKEKNMTKAELGHLKELPHFRTLKAYNFEKTDLKRGDVVDVNTFKVGDIVNVTGTSRGMGFAGVVKRHHFHGHNATHGTKHAERAPGSIGSGWPQHVLKGMRMAGRMGGAKVTTKGLQVVDVVPNTNILVVRGAVPGPKNSLLSIVGE
ncbi:MAG: 50S ribosomal protein L3 [bacterium]|nr:50S ribosomal protein L3 [bacterium]